MPVVSKAQGPRMETKKKDLPVVPMARSMCWHCQSDIGGEYFCGQCVKVQPLSKDIDYFTCLGLPRKLNIDTVSLENKFYELSRAFHPDFYEGKSEMERAVSLAAAGWGRRPRDLAAGSSAARDAGRSGWRRGWPAAAGWRSGAPPTMTPAWPAGWRLPGPPR